MKERIITGIVMFLVLVPLLIVKELIIGLQIIFAGLTIIGSLEMLKMYNKEYSIKIKIVTSLLSLGTYLMLAAFPVSGFAVGNLGRVGLSLLFSVVVLSLLTILDEEFSGDNFNKILFSTLYVSFGLGSIVMLRLNSVKFVIILLLTTSLTDIFAYAVGMNFGKNKMAPTISPNKSWEGAIGGIIIAVTIVSLVGIFYGNIFTGSFLNEDGVKTILDTIPNLQTLNIVGKSIVIVLLTMTISVIGQIGDLIASKMKRKYEIKDFGNVFPGHGGVLDRFDSAIFAGMYTLFLFVLIGLF